MIKKIAPNKGMINIEALGNPNAFKSKVNLGVVPKFNKHGDNIEPIIRRIPVQSIDEYTPKFTLDLKALGLPNASILIIPLFGAIFFGGVGVKNGNSPKHK
jgi:hypothetical protein